jgi:hypothetical protein
MKPVRRVVLDGRVTRIYGKGRLFLSEPGETLQEMTEGAIAERGKEAEAINECLLCDQPSVYWGLFMTGEETTEYSEKRPATGTFFGLCERHNPSHENEDEVCDAVYKIMESRLKVENGLEKAERAVNVWLEQLTKGGFRKKESLEIILSKFKAGKLVTAHEFPEEMKKAIEMAIKEEIRKECH